MMPAMSDAADVLARLRARDVAAIARIVDEHAAVLYRAGRAAGLQADAAEDLAQDTFVTFLETLDRFEGRAKVRTWLFGILFHKIRERRRAALRVENRDPADDLFASWFDRDGAWISPPPGPDDRLRSVEIRRAIRTCVETLPELQRHTFYLRHVEELSGSEASKILGESVTHIGVLLHRARVRLRECLERRGMTP